MFWREADDASVWERRAAESDMQRAAANASCALDRNIGGEESAHD